MTKPRGERDFCLSFSFPARHSRFADATPERRIRPRFPAGCRADHTKQIEEAKANLNGLSSVVEQLVRHDIISADDISRSLAAQAEMKWIDLATRVVPQDVIDEIKPEDARRFRMIPIARNENSLVVATGDPLRFRQYRRP